MKGWKITGIIAAVVIILSIPVYLFKSVYFAGDIGGEDSLSQASFVGGRKCTDCHKKEYDKWQGSHHDRAMSVASEETVLGNFDDSVFQIHGVKSRFYRRDGKFWVHTQGPNGKMGEYEITHTFGWYPLQQYLVPFPGGRLQCLPITWDVEAKKWFHQSPEAPVDPKDWLYWTNAGQNWNGMCAECHSTNLKKNYDIDTDSYQTTWSEINVSCEACHGPGSHHVAWAEMPDMARPTVENYGLVVKTSNLKSRELVELCAPCHSRRAILGDYTHAEADLLDSMLPSLLTQELYFPDGQILDEVYVYGSFTQSKMYHRDVRCSDCHDVHSVKTIEKGNELCVQCHRAEEYDTTAHHFHKKEGDTGVPIRSSDGRILFKVGSGAECTQCHMPGRHYMGIDYRPDHSFRIPRPDLSLLTNSPNACNRCHIDKSSRWSDEQMTKWYGPGRKGHYAVTIEEGRRRLPEAANRLSRMAIDPLYPVIVRATALSLLNGYPGESAQKVYQLSLMDEEALIRRTAVTHFNDPDPRLLAMSLTPLLYDPVKAVRIEVAARLAGAPAEQLAGNQKAVFKAALDEYVDAMAYSGDFAFGRYNLGNLDVALNKPDAAIKHYEAAVKIDNLFYPAKVNMAMLYNQINRKDEAEKLLRETVEEQPQLHEAAYSLGLLMAERQNYEEAARFLSAAAQGMPDRARIHYNLGLLLQYRGRWAEAEKSLIRALEIEPDTLDFMHAMADHYIRRGNLKAARSIAEQMVAKHPDQSIGLNILNFLDKESERGQAQ